MRGVMLGLVGVLVSCGPPPDPLFTCESSLKAATLEADIQPQIFNKSCRSCHNLNAPAYGDYSSLEKSLADTVNKTSLYAKGSSLKVVDPKNLANSSLWLKVNGGSPKYVGPNGADVLSQMPLGSMLSDADKLLIKSWICSGAK